MLLMVSCGNSNASEKTEKEAASDAADAPAENVSAAEKVDPAEAPAEVAYEQFTFERHGVVLDVLKGMRLMDDPETDNMLSWTIVPENDDDPPFHAALTVGVLEVSGDYDDRSIQENYDMLTGVADKKIDLKKKEITYSYAGGDEQPTEFRRIIFKGKKQVTIGIAYTKRWEKRLGGEVCDHILNSAKFK